MINLIKQIKWYLKPTCILFCHFFLLIPFSPLVRYKKYLLLTWQDSGKRSFIDNLFYPIVLESWIKYEYLREPNPDRREETNLSLWVEPAG